MTDDERADHLWRALNSCASLNRELTIATVTHWLEYHGAGHPDVPMVQEKIRAEALFWSELASQAELEAYVAAGVMALERAPLTSKAIKRLAALAWKKMDAEARLGFRNWIGSE